MEKLVRCNPCTRGRQVHGAPEAHCVVACAGARLLSELRHFDQCPGSRILHDFLQKLADPGHPPVRLRVQEALCLPKLHHHLALFRARSRVPVVTAARRDLAA